MFKLDKKSLKKISLRALIALAVIGISYSGYTYWQSRNPATEPQKPPVEEPEKAYEIVDNPDGDHIYISHKFGYKLIYPNNWEFLEKQSQGISAQFVFKGGSLNDSFHIVAGKARNEARFPTLRDLLSYLDDTKIPAVPNFEVSGVPAHKYPRFSVQDRDVLIVSFEYNNYVFTIYLPWEKRADPEYMKVLNSFEFTD